MPLRAAGTRPGQDPARSASAGSARRRRRRRSRPAALARSLTERCNGRRRFIRAGLAARSVRSGNEIDHPLRPRRPLCGNGSDERRGCPPQPRRSTLSGIPCGASGPGAPPVRHELLRRVGFGSRRPGESKRAARVGPPLRRSERSREALVSPPCGADGAARAVRQFQEMTLHHAERRRSATFRSRCTAGLSQDGTAEAPGARRRLAVRRRLGVRKSPARRASPDQVRWPSSGRWCRPQAGHSGIP